jgi:vacuolar-type H+-ATPase subunit E/Vma4
MNAQRRKELKAIIEKLEQLDALRQEVQEMLEAVRDEETEALENMPEGLQESDRGQQMQEYIDNMDGTVDDLDMMDIQAIIDQLQEIVDG